MRTHSVSIVLTTLLLVAGLTIAPFAALGPAPATASAQSGFTVDDSDTAPINPNGSIEGDLSVLASSADGAVTQSYSGDAGAIKVNGETPPDGLTITAEADQSQELVRFKVGNEIATINSVTLNGEPVATEDDTKVNPTDSLQTQQVDLSVDGANYTVTITDTPTEVAAGDELTVGYEIENTGPNDLGAPQDISFEVTNETGETVATETEPDVDLASGQVFQGSFNYTPTAGDVPQVEATVASANDAASATVDVLGPANFTVSIDDAASTTDVIAGENAVINATIENTGGQTGTQTIDFTVNDTSVDSTEVTNLAGGATETVEFTYPTELADDGATARVASDNDTDSSTLTVGEPANFTVSIDDAASTTDVIAGEDVVVTATIENTGDETATQTIDFSVNGTVENSTEVNLTGGATETVEFTYPTGLADDGATATVASDNDTASRTLSVAPAPANFDVSINAGASTTEVIAGEDAVITAIVENTGDETGTQTINFTVNGTTEDSVEVTDLAGGATETVEFTYTTDLADDGATAAVASDNDTATETLSVGEQANFDVTITDAASTTSVTAGEDAVINATIENTGDETATQTIDFTVNGTNEDSTSVTLDGGATETVEFTYNTELADDGATAAVASNDDSANRTLSVAPTPPNFTVSINNAASITDVIAGEDAVINATIENTGDETGTQTVNFTVNGTTEDNVSVTLPGGATDTVEFTYATDLADDGATAAVASDNATATETLTVGEQANFSVSITDATSTTDVIAGEDAVINATIENTGDETATQTINFTVNDTVEDNVSVELGGGATETVEFTYNTELADDNATAEVASDNASDSTQLTVGEPANFDVTITDAASTTDVTAGEDAVINATIENTGDETATQTINFTVDGTVENSTEVNLAGGATETVEFTYTTDLADDGATAEVASNDDSANRTLNIAPAPANFDVTITDAASTTDVIAGEDVVVNATIENTGDETGTQTINFTVNDTSENSTEVTLAGGATETVEFTYTTDLADDGATARVASDNDTATETLSVGAPANLNVTIDDAASTTDVLTGEDAVITATVENTGDETATQTINFSINDTVENSTEVTLAGGATESVEFTYTTDLADDGATARVASDNDTASRTLTVSEPEPANFTVSIDDAASTTSVTAGEDAVVTATIENTGDETGTQTINFSVNGTVENSTEVTLAGGATDTVEFTYTTDLADDGATATVTSDNDTASRTLTVTEPAPANFTVSDLQPQDTTVTAGQNFTVSATLTNTGDQPGEQDIQLLTEPTGGSVLATEPNVSLAGGANTTVSFENVSVGTAGEFNHTVASENDSATGSLTVEDEAQPEPQGSVTFNNQTVPNGTETVTVASANYTLADGTSGDYVVVAHVVNDDGSITPPVGYSSNLTGEAAGITVDLNASEAQGDALDTLTANTTLRAMLHETSSNSAFGPSLGLATDDATITVEDDAQPDPANFTVSDLQPQDATVTVGENFTVSATITNTGDQAGEQDIQLLTEPTGGSVLATETVALDAGNSTTVTFENVSVETAGEFNHTVASDDDAATGSLTVEAQPETANLTGLDIAGQGDTARLTPGAERNVTVTLANTGGEQGTFAVALNITANGTTVGTETQEVSLASGANTTVTFENVTGDLAADEYNLTVTAAESAVTGSLTVKAAPAAIGGDENATAQDTDGDGTFEDVNGDGNFTIADVFELFNNQDAVPEDDTAAFDFNNDGDFNVLDVQRLLNQQQEES